MKNILLATILALGYSSSGLACDYTDLRPDPDAENCSGFLQCANGYEFPIPCPEGFDYFDYAEQGPIQ